MQLDKSTTLEKILQFSRRLKNDIILEEDTRLTEEADRMVMVHSRKSTGPTEFLPGYGTTNFGVSSFVEKPMIPERITGFFTLGRLASVVPVMLLYLNAGTLVNYVLLRREEYITRNK